MTRASIPNPSINDLTPYQRVRALKRVRDIREGRLRIPLRCTHCRGVALTEDRDYPGEALCGACGKRSGIEDMKVLRRAEIKATILHGPLEDKT